MKIRQFTPPCDECGPDGPCSHCPTCERRNCYAHCYETPNGAHEADPMSARQPDSSPMIVDYSCKHCDQSGSVEIAPESILWG